MNLIRTNPQLPFEYSLSLGVDRTTVPEASRMQNHFQMYKSKIHLTTEVSYARVGISVS